MAPASAPAANTSDTDVPCFALVPPNDAAEPASVEVLRKQLESGPDDARIAAMKVILRSLLNGEAGLSSLLMHIIRFVVPSRSKPLKRLLLHYLEACAKCGPDGKLLQEMILVCNALRNDLMHPNEYVRGTTLRLIPKLGHPELVEPLVQSMRQCLEHRHPYVRRNAIYAVHDVYKTMPDLIENAPTIIADLISKESESSCRRAAFAMLQACAPNLAVAYLGSVVHLIPTFDENLQLVIIATLRKEARANPACRKIFMKLLFSLLQASDLSVKFEAATSLCTLTRHPTAVLACMRAYVQLLSKTPSNNVKLIVLERMSDLIESTDSLEDENLPTELLRCLSAPDLEVRRRICRVAVDLASARSADAMVSALRRELVKQAEVDLDSSPEYRLLLIQTLHACAVQVPSCMAVCVRAVTDLVTDSCYTTAVEASILLREALHKSTALCPKVLDSLIATLCSLKSGKVMRSVLWILGEHVGPAHAMRALDAIKAALGEIMQQDPEHQDQQDQQQSQMAAISQSGPMTAMPLSPTGASTDQSPASASSLMPLSAGMGLRFGATPADGGRVGIMPDGSYAGGAQQQLLSPRTMAYTEHRPRRPPLQALLQSSDYYSSTVLATCITKICLRVRASSLGNNDPTTGAALNDQCSSEYANEVLAESLNLIGRVLQFGLQHTIDEDSFQRIEQCVAVLCSNDAPADLISVFIAESKSLLDEFLQRCAEEGPWASTAAGCKVCLNTKPHAPDTTAVSTHLPHRSGRKTAAKTGRIGSSMSFSLLQSVDKSGRADEYEVDKYKAAHGGSFGSSQKSRSNMGVSGGKSGSKLKHLVQLTGFSDSVYAEAYVIVNQNDILLDVLIVNQTDKMMQNLVVEFATLGDLRILERPASVNLAPQSYHTLKTTVKVASTETGVIFGNVSYDIGPLNSRTVILSDIYIDVIDYIQPATCNETRFRSMWVEFEWENKVFVFSQVPEVNAVEAASASQEVSAVSSKRAFSLHDFLDHITKSTNMACLTREPVMEDNRGCGIIAANLYARSVFGEDALANLCVERLEPGQPVTGHVRIRSKTQGIALSLGEKITRSQKRFAETFSKQSQPCAS